MPDCKKYQQGGDRSGIGLGDRPGQGWVPRPNEPGRLERAWNTERVEGISCKSKSDDDGPLPRVGSNVVTKADVKARRHELQAAGVRFPPWKVDAAVVRVMRDIILHGCLNVDPAKKAKAGYYSDKYCVGALASEIKVALPWSLRLATEELILIIRSAEGVREERTAKGILISLHLGQEVARHHRKGLALQRQQLLINEGWYKEDDVADWRNPQAAVGSAQIPEKVRALTSEDESSECV